MHRRWMLLTQLTYGLCPNLLQVISGDGSLPHIATANATGNIIADVLIPLCDWLELKWMIEQPATTGMKNKCVVVLFHKRKLQ